VAGVKLVGKLSVANQAATLTADGLYGTQVLPTLGKHEKFELTTGTLQGKFAGGSGHHHDDHGRSTVMTTSGGGGGGSQSWSAPAVVSNDFGSGKSLLFAFDLAAMVTADVVQANGQLSTFVNTSATNAASGTVTLTLGDVTQVVASATNQGTRTVSFKAEATLPAGLTSMATVPAAQLVTNANGTVQATWNFTLAAGATQDLRWTVQAGQTGNFEVPFSIYSLPRAGSTAPPKLRASGTASLEVKTGTELAQKPAVAIDALHPTTSSDKNKKNKAQQAAFFAASLHAQGNHEAAIDQWLAAADALADITSVDTTDAQKAVALAIEASTDESCVQHHGGCGQPAREHAE
jgi:hypothetical protein